MSCDLLHLDFIIAHIKLKEKQNKTKKPYKHITIFSKKERKHFVIVLFVFKGYTFN